MGAAAQYEVERIVDARSVRGTGGKRKEQLRVRWKGWQRADDTWEDAATLRREVPLAVSAFIAGRRAATGSSGGIKKRRRSDQQRRAPACSSRRARPAACEHPRAQKRSEPAAAVRARLPSVPHRELFDLMRRQFPTTSPADVAQIISESQCLLTIQDERGVVTAGAACSFDDDEHGQGKLGFLHFLATDVKGRKYGTVLLRGVALFLQRRGVARLCLDSQTADDTSAGDAAASAPSASAASAASAAPRGSRNDPVAFYRACGCTEEAGAGASNSSSGGSGAGGGSSSAVPMVGNVSEILPRCTAKLLQLAAAERHQLLHSAHVRLLPPIDTSAAAEAEAEKQAAVLAVPVSIKAINAQQQQQQQQQASCSSSSSSFCSSKVDGTLTPVQHSAVCPGTTTIYFST